MAVAYLDKPQCGGGGGGGGGAAGRCRRGLVAGDVADDLAAGDRKDDGRAEPGGVPHELAPGHSVLATGDLRLARIGVPGLVPGHDTTTLPVMNGWMVQ